MKANKSLSILWEYESSERSKSLRKDALMNDEHGFFFTNDY